MYVGILIGEQWQLGCFDQSVRSWSRFPVFTRSFHTANNNQFIHDYGNTFHNSSASHRLRVHNISSPTGWINCLHMWWNDEGARLHHHACLLPLRQSACLPCQCVCQPYDFEKNMNTSLSAIFFILILRFKADGHVPKAEICKPQLTKAFRCTKPSILWWVCVWSKP